MFIGAFIWFLTFFFENHKYKVRWVIIESEKINAIEMRQNEIKVFE